VALWDQALGGREELDYAVASIRSERSPAGGERFESEVTFRRLGGLRTGVEVEAEFENGERDVEFWNGAGPWHRVTWTRPFRVRSARVDPLGRRPLDRVASNNGLAREPDHRPAVRHGARVLLWLQHVLAFGGGAS
jgi:hypothetical protein